MFDGSANIIGGTTAGTRNVISGNGIDGVQIVGPHVTGNLIQGNFIGADAGGASDVGNAQDGVFVLDSSGNGIGGISEGAANTVAFNGAAGVRVSIRSGTSTVPGIHNGTTTRNAILSNSIFANVELGIDLAMFGVAGVTPNDDADEDWGPNNLQNFPVILMAEARLNGDLLAEYGVNSATDSSSYPILVAFFLADSDGEEGMTLLGRDSYSASSAETPKVVNLGNAAQLGVEGGDAIVATATDADNNTSEFSPSRTVTVQPPPELSVTDVTVDEPAANAPVTITVDHSDADVTVDFCTGDGTAVSPEDYTPLGIRSGKLDLRNGSRVYHRRRPGRGRRDLHRDSV